jgi:two-component system response regulator AtoC
MADERTGIDLPAGIDATERIQHTGPSTPHLLIISHNGTWTSRSLSTGGVYTIGRGDDADVHLEDQAVSRQHARLEVGGAGDLRLVDLNSENGSLVGSKLIRNVTATMRPGELIQIGRTVLAVQAPSSFVGDPQLPPQAGLAMANVDALVGKASSALIDVLLLGETGAGKGVIAQRIHSESARMGNQFMQLNCAALSADLLESELFGHEKGAFTNALQTKRGLLEEASGGTVFLDEIGEMPLAVQAKLLLAIEQRVTRRVGATRTTRFDVRFICATHRDLENEVRLGRFRKDFYYRIKQLTIRIPPLRERRDEIEGLALQFAKDAAARMGSDQPPVFDDDARRRLYWHDWEGNVRELKMTVENAVLLTDDNVITSYILTRAGLPPAAPLLPSAGSAEAASASIGSAETEHERERVIAALAACGGNQSRAARTLGMARNTLLRLIGLYNLPRPRGDRD